MKKIYFIFLFFSFIQLCYSQIDSLSNDKRYEKINWTNFNSQGKSIQLWKKSIVPVSLIGIGLSLNNTSTKTQLQNNILTSFNGHSSTIDDYIQYAPILQLYTADFFKLKARNSIWNQTKYLFISELFTGIIVQTLKHTLKIERPDQSAFTSFPSGHTSQSFVGSQVLFNEFNQTHKLLAYSGYLFSISTGAYRVINNKHWVPDVIVGAGIAILVTNIVYYFEPLKNWNPWKKRNINVSFYPQVGEDYYLANFRLKF